jgi:putative ABC transport system permease protein
VLAIVATAVTVAASGTVLNAWALVDRATRDGYRASNPPSATIRIDDATDSLLGRVELPEGVVALRARRVLSASMQAQGRWANAIIFASADYRDDSDSTPRDLKVASAKIGRLILEAGSWPLEPGTIAIEQSSLELSGAVIGETVDVVIDGGESVQFKVSGIVRDVGLAPGWMEHVIYAFTTTETLAALSRKSAYNELQIRTSARSHESTHELESQRPHESEISVIRRISEATASALDSAGIHVEQINVPEPGRHIHAAQMDSLLLVQGAFGVLALVVAGFLIVNLMTALLSGQVREIGIMKTIGAERSQLTGMYLTVSLSIGSIATLLALPVAIEAGREYGSLKGELLNFDVSSVSIPAYVVLLQICVGTLLPVVAALFPVTRAARMSVADSLRDVGIRHAGVEFNPRFWPRFVSRPTLLAIRNGFRNRQRLILTLLVLSSGGAVFIGANNLKVSVIRSIDSVFDAHRYDFSVRLKEAAFVDSIESIVRSVAGVEDAEAWAGIRMTSDTYSHGEEIVLTAPSSTSRLFQPRVIAGRWFSTGETNAIVVNTAMQRADTSLVPGKIISAVVDGKPQSFGVVGIIESGLQAAAYSTRETAIALSGNKRLSTIVVKIKHDETSNLLVIQRVRDQLTSNGIAVASTSLLEETRRVTSDHLLMVVQFLGAMGWIMVIVGGMSLGSTMSFAVIERTREIGVLRAIGAQHSSIMMLIQTEGISIALLSWLLALPLSVPISAVLSLAFGRIMMRVPMRLLPDVNGMLLWLSISIAIAILASAAPAIKACRITVRQSLTYE